MTPQRSTSRRAPPAAGGGGTVLARAVSFRHRRPPRANRHAARPQQTPLPPAPNSRAAPPPAPHAPAHPGARAPPLSYRHCRARCCPIRRHTCTRAASRAVYSLYILRRPARHTYRRRGAPSRRAASCVCRALAAALRAERVFSGRCARGCARAPCGPSGCTGTSCLSTCRHRKQRADDARLRCAGSVKTATPSRPHIAKHVIR